MTISVPTTYEDQDASSKKPTTTMKKFLLIHGAWGGAWEFEETITGLRELGHEANAIDLPGHGKSSSIPIPNVTMKSYVDRVVEAVEAIEGKVVLVGHSLGGSVISQVAELIPNKIERLVFVAAILPRNGETALGIMQSDPEGQLLPRLKFSEDQSYATVTAKDAKEVFLHDVRDAEQLANFLPPFEMKQATEPFMFAANLSEQKFGSVSKTYVRATMDKVLSPHLQDSMISSWEVDHVFSLESGHFPLMSNPGSLIKVLDEAVTTGVETV